MRKSASGGRVSLLSSFITSPLFFILLGALPAVSIVYFWLSLETYRFYLIVFIALTFLGALLTLLYRGDGRAILILIGAGGFGLYALFLFHGYMLTSGWLQEGTYYFEGELNSRGEYRLSSADGEPVRGQVFVRAGSEIDHPAPGESHRLAVTGHITWSREDDDFARYLRQQRQLGILQPRQVHSQESLGEELAGLRRFLVHGYQRLGRRWPLSAAFTRALLLGERDALPGYIDRLLRNCGLAHLFVISGLHVGIIFFWLSSLLPKLSPLRRFLFFLLFFILYLTFIGWPVSALRAVIMILLLSLSQALERRLRPPDFLLGAVFILMLLDPFVLLRAGFQLTAAATLGIFAVRPYESLIGRGKLRQLFLYNAGAFLGVFPVVLYHFNYLPAWGIVFSYAAGLIFPLFLPLLLIQNLFLWTHWTFFADLIEQLFAGFFHLLERFFVHGNFISAIGGINGITVIVLLATIWFMVDIRWPNFVRASGAVVVVLILSFVLMPPSEPHLEQKLVAGVPVTHLAGPAESSTLIIPRRLRLDGYRVRSLNRYLEDRGVVELDFLLSDYRPQVLRRLGFDLPVGQYATYWGSEGSVEFPGGKYDIETNQLSSNLVKISYNNPPGESYVAYDPEAVAGYTTAEEILLADEEKVAPPLLAEVQDSDWSVYELSKEAFVRATDGREVELDDVIFTVEQRLFQTTTDLY